MKSLAREVLAANVKSLIAADQPGKPVSIRGWAVSKKIDPKKVERLMKAANGASCETIQEVADAVHRPPWQLLAPGMQAPIPNISPKAAELARLYDAIESPAERRRAYAIARLALTGQTPGPQSPDEEDERPERASAPKSKQPAAR